MTKILIAAGGTAGHVVPALAVAEELQARGAEVHFAGTRGRAEEVLVPAAGHEISYLSVSGLDRRNALRAARATGQAALALPAARRLLRSLRPDAVLGAGGYVAGPVGLAAALGRTPLVLTEADSHLGMANRLLAPFARRVCLAFPIQGREPPRYRVTGRPVAREVCEAERDEARARLGIEGQARCLLVFGGSLGARSLNDSALDAFAHGDGEGLQPLVLHVSGQRDFGVLSERLRQLGDPAHYRLVEYLPSMGDALAAADLVLARAGGSIFEVTAAGRPAVLVPYPHATADHQAQNARWMEQGGAARVIPDGELDGLRLREMVTALLDDEATLTRMSQAARAIARPRAAADVADELLAAAPGRGAEPGGAKSGSAPPGHGAPWEGRRLHFVGIGGAGMSGLALIARRLGAQVSGCDRAETPYLRELREAGIEPSIGHDAEHAHDAGELVVSTAIPADAPELVAARRLGLPIHHRTELLAEAASMRRVLAVAGTHGKTTTSAMVAHVLEACDASPSFLIGAELGGGRPNARWGEGEWLVLEADESDRSFLRFSPEVAVVTNAELDHHTTYKSELELQRAFEDFLARLAPEGTAVVWNELALRVPDGRTTVTYGVEGKAGLVARSIVSSGLHTSFELQRDGRHVCSVELGVPGTHNVLDALAALAACEAAGVDLAGGAAALASFHPARRRFEPRGERAGARIYDDYAHHPTEVAATLQAARALEPRRLIAVFQPHLYSRTLHLHRDFGRALAAADEIVVLDVYPARERPEGELAGVSGRIVADAAADHAPGRVVWWLPTIEEAATVLAHRLGVGDVLITLGAGDVDRLAGLLLDPGGKRGRHGETASGHASHREGTMSGPGAGLPEGIERDYPLARLTTIRTGGPAEYFARVTSLPALELALRWAGDAGIDVGTVGSGSNLLVADDGVRGLVVKLDGELARIEHEHGHLVCGGGARLPQVSARAAALGLSGIEFGVNIPGTVGGAVKMNANAYGGELGSVLEWVDVCAPAGTERRLPAQLGFSYRRSNLGGREIVAQASFALAAGDPAAIRSEMSDMRRRRKDAQPSGIKTFGSTFKNPQDERAEGRSSGQLLEAAGCKGLRIGGARFSPKHANFIENVDGRATTADVLGLIAEGRRRVHERLGVWLEPEVQLLGDAHFDWDAGRAEEA